MAYAEKTKVSVARSRAQIEELVRDAGATDVIAGDLGSQGFAFVAFRLEGRNIRLSVPEPSLYDVPTHDGRGTKRNEERRRRDLEQTRRARWRLLHIVVKAKLELIEIGAATVEDEFLAAIQGPDGRTIGEVIKPQLDFDSPPLLSAGGSR